jgi:hypothetical protein
MVPKQQHSTVLFSRELQVDFNTFFIYLWDLAEVIYIVCLDFKIFILKQGKVISS